MKYLKKYESFEDLMYSGYKYIIICENEEEFVDVQKYLKKYIPQIKFELQNSYDVVKQDFVDDSNFRNKKTIDEVYVNLKDENSPIFLYVLNTMEMITGDEEKYIKDYSKKGVPVIEANNIDQLKSIIEAEKLGLL